MTQQALWGQVAAVMNKPGVELYHIFLTVRVRPEGRQYAAWCDELGVHTCGDTLDEAFTNGIEAVLCYLNGLEELGERRRVFDERGIEPHHGMPPCDAVPTPVAPDEFVRIFTAQRAGELVG